MAGYGGYYNLPFDPSPSSAATQDMFADFDLAYDALLSQYQPQFGGSSFWDWLSGSGRRATGDRFNQRNADILAGGGSIFDIEDPLTFLKGFDFSNSFRALSPQQRGEGSGLSSPFTRFLTR